MLFHNEEPKIVASRAADWHVLSVTAEGGMGSLLTHECGDGG